MDIAGFNHVAIAGPPFRCIKQSILPSKPHTVPIFAEGKPFPSGALANSNLHGVGSNSAAFE
jgi:hypothetical protein